MKKIALFVVFLSLLAPSFVVAQSIAPVQSVNATFGGNAGLYFSGPYGGNGFIVDGARSYVRGTVRIDTADGEVSMLLTGTVDRKTGKLKASISGAHDLNFAAKKEDRQTSYLRTVFDGEWDAVMKSHVVKKEPYIWEGPVKISYLVVLSKAVPVGVNVPEEKKSYDGTLKISIDPLFVAGLGEDDSGKPTIKEPVVTLTDVKANVITATTTGTVLATSTDKNVDVKNNDITATSTPSTSGTSSNALDTIYVVVAGIVVLIALVAMMKKSKVTKS